MEEAKSFARNPRPVLEAKRTKAKATAARRKARRRSPRSNQTRKPTRAESFWNEDKKRVYDLIPLSEDDVVRENVSRVSRAFDALRCDARANEPKRNLRKQEIKHNSKTFCFRAINKLMTPEQKEGFRIVDRVHRQVYNATVARVEHLSEEGTHITEILRLTFKKEIRAEVFGKRGTGVTWGIRNCARHIPSKSLTLAEMEERVKEEWGKVPFKIKEDAVEQALLAYKTSFEKRKKQRERGEAVKPFNVHFRKYGQMSVITLPKSKVLMDFVRCEKKTKKKKAKKNDKKKKKKKAKKKKKKKKKKRTRTETNENTKVHFFAKFSNVGDWCRSMREDGKAESGVRLCASKKVAELVLANNCANVKN